VVVKYLKQRFRNGLVMHAWDAGYQILKVDTVDTNTVHVIMQVKNEPATKRHFKVTVSEVRDK